MEMGSRTEVDEDGDNNKGRMWDLDQQFDRSIEEEAGRLKNMYTEKVLNRVFTNISLLLLRLAFQSLGVVYGDLGTSPHVFYNTFPEEIVDPEDVVGALSLIIYSLTLIPLLKYVFVVCKANDNGQGGTFALYSLLCRHANVKNIPDQHRTDEELTTYSCCTLIHEKSFAAKTKRWLEKDTYRKNALLILVLFGTCNVIGDGILTPAISVLSASGGLKVAHPRMSNGVILVVAVVILVGLFSMQHYGTDKVSWLFAPIVLLWFITIGGIGAYNIWKYGSSVLKAFSPVYIFRYFKRRRRDGWTSLGGIMLSITGTEALFADLAHFPVSAVQLAFTVVVFPCLLLAYSGQAAYLFNKGDHVIDPFYRSIPGWDSCGARDVGNHGTYDFNHDTEMHGKVSMAWILGLGPSLGLVRVPGTGLVYTELASGVPHIFSHFITNLPAIHSVLVFVCVKYLPVYTVPEEERFFVKRVGPKNFHMFRCIARYGYKDLHKKDDDFEKKLFDNLFLFVRLESMMEGCSDSEEYSWSEPPSEHSRDGNEWGNTMVSSSVNTTVVSYMNMGQISRSQTEMDELEFLNRCREAGVVHILGNTMVRARKDARFYKRIAIDYIYAFLRKICRENSAIFNVPHESLLNVGQIIYV
ncbi:Potassium transporter 11 -like protein [Gossypium arboreum]|uniref:Potassium transporter 11-like protein n=1 Tax=Gossypium arboreum TaxID=29729 RepID=A0A0B0MBL4_GOSAR|nr:Potassium transporter 11 -like protein [Gossypium arboreum]